MQDIQATAMTSRFPIEAVGIKNLKYPLTLAAGSGADVQTVAAEWTLQVALTSGQRGTHMSRFISSLHEFVKTPIDLARLSRFAASLLDELGSKEAQITVTFPWFRTVKAPVSEQPAMMDGKVVWTADAYADANKNAQKQSVAVAVTSLCPCSKAISDRGAHNQRSWLQVGLTYEGGASVLGLDKVAAMLESCASAPLYPVLKRADEKFVTEKAYDNPAFVEDLVRSVAETFSGLPGVRRLEVEALNIESIHNHDCFARISVDL